MSWQVLLGAVFLLQSLASASPYESSGIVANVVDGDTIDIQDVGRVRLADVDTPEINRPGGPEAKAYAEKWLLHNMTYLDIDDKSRIDSTEYNRLVCIVYLKAPGGALVNFNKIMAESGHACVQDYPTNEFTPDGWWNGTIPKSVVIEPPGGALTPDAENRLGLAPPMGQKFIGSTQSNKYHNPECRWARRISTKNEIYFTSADDAKSKGYIPCGSCHPVE